MAHGNPDEDYIRMMNGIRLQEAADLCERARKLRKRSMHLLHDCRRARQRAETGLHRAEVTMSLLLEYVNNPRAEER